MEIALGIVPLVIGIALALGAPVIAWFVTSHHLRQHEKQIALAAGAAAETAARYAARGAAVELRIRTLEHIVAARGIDLAEETERLRARRTRARMRSH